MTVKELIETLEGCNQDSIVTVREHPDASPTVVTDSMIWLSDDRKHVIIDLSTEA